MLTAIGHNLTRVARFSGRDSRVQFWPYAVALFGLAVAGMTMVFLPVMRDSMMRMQRFAAEHPGQAHIEQGPGHYSITIEGYHPELMPDLSGASYAFAVVVALFVLLVAASVARRLHDRDKSGLWGLLPLPFLAASFALFPVLSRSFSASEPDFGLFGLLFLNNLLYLAVLGYLILLLIGQGTPGPNRFGPEPGRMD